MTVAIFLFCMKYESFEYLGLTGSTRKNKTIRHLQLALRKHQHVGTNKMQTCLSCALRIVDVYEIWNNTYLSDFCAPIDSHRVTVGENWRITTPRFVQHQALSRGLH